MDGKREEQLNRGLLEFIQESPSVFHVIENLKKGWRRPGLRRGGSRTAGNCSRAVLIM